MNELSLQLGFFIKKMKCHQEYCIYQFLLTKSSLWQYFMKIPWWRIITVMKIHQMKTTYICDMRSTHQADQLCFAIFSWIWPFCNFVRGAGWVGESKIKDHLSPAKAELGNKRTQAELSWAKHSRNWGWRGF